MLCEGANIELTDSNVAGLLRLLDGADEHLLEGLLDQLAAMPGTERERIEQRATGAGTDVRVALRRARIRAGYLREQRRWELAVARPRPRLEDALVVLGDAAGMQGVSDVSARLDALAAEVGERLSGDRAFDTGLAAIVEVLHVKHKLRGSEANYHHPSNSYLQCVLDTGLGIPISLCVVALLVGQRLGLPVHGMSTPGHFLGFYGDADLGIGTWFDPFRGFARISQSQATALVAQFDEGFQLTPAKPADERQILERWLNNLMSAWSEQAEREHLRNLALYSAILLR
ncbi:MAG: transglutaminase family protein [Planctomycetes bacterium]|nr:transglutaminase family protein [Planctomycetota bacterium]